MISGWKNFAEKIKSYNFCQKTVCYPTVLANSLKKIVVLKISRPVCVSIQKYFRLPMKPNVRSYKLGNWIYFIMSI